MRQSASYAQTAQTVQQLAVETDPEKRNSELASLAARRAAGEVAWNAYRRLSVKLPGEGKLRRTFEANRKLGLAAGAQLFTGSDDSVTAFAHFATLSNAMLADLNKIKELYETQAQDDLHGVNQDLDARLLDIFLLAVAVFIGLSVAFGFAIHASARA